MQKISDYKTLFVDLISMAATYPILSPHRAILYQIDNIVSKSLIGDDGSICQYDIVLYGSYGFGAEISTSDIDICILISMENNNYISKLINAFAMTNTTTFTNIKFIPSSFKSPNLIMMDTEQYHIDLAFSNVQPIVFDSCDGNILEFLNNKYIELDPIEYSYLFVDQPSVCASYALLLGYHIMSIAPDLKSYTDALIQIKINSIEQKIYGSNTGYLNGATLAIMLLYIVASSSASSDTAISASDIIMEFYKIFSDWDWATYGLVINSKHPPLKLTKLEIAQAANDTSMKFTMLVDTYGACSSCTVWPDTLYQIQRVFRLNYLGPIYASTSAATTSTSTTVSKLVINGNFSERGLAKKIQMITKAFRRNINCDYAYSHYASQLLIYPEPCIEGIIICVNMAHFFTGLNYNKFLAIANGVIANESW
jgi:poly(A) polymerase Pap1